MRKRFVTFLTMIAVLTGVSCAKTEKVTHPLEDPEETARVALAERKKAQLSAILSELSIPTAELILQNADAFITELESVMKNDTDYLLTLVDKRHFLQQSYVPEDLVPLSKNTAYNISRNDLSLRVPAAEALTRMALGAKNDGITLLVSSSFRSYDYQKTVYERNVKQMGQQAADRESARPGTSQHQLGTAIDFGSITDDFADTKQGKWLTANAHRYGFSLSFPDGYEDVTGYRYECWHYRYIGQEAAAFQKKWFNDIQQYMLEVIAGAEKASLVGDTL